tara:strand:- start:5710 stop:6630 length:921 start_codon:yes stop_codon:yes gene_type:complete
MNIIIYPDPDKDLNVNEKLLSHTLYLDNFEYFKDTEIKTMGEKFNKIINKINSIFIFKDNYGCFLKTNIDFILKNKTIKFYILENDIHYLKSKSNAYNRYLLIRNNLINNTHINILAFYWYQYKNLYKINENNLICFPKFAPSNSITKFNNNPEMKILLSGSTSSAYPMRKYLKSLNHPLVKILTQQDNIRGQDYYKYINKFVCAFSCCSNKNTPYIVSKFFEIPATGSLLLAYDEFVKEPLKELGFIDGVNYISCNKENIIEKINWICDINNIEEINKIRKKGQELVINKHTLKNRFNLINSLEK